MKNSPLQVTKNAGPKSRLDIWRNERRCRNSDSAGLSPNSNASLFISRSSPSRYCPQADIVR